VLFSIFSEREKLVFEKKLTFTHLKGKKQGKKKKYSTTKLRKDRDVLGLGVHFCDGEGGGNTRLEEPRRHEGMGKEKLSHSRGMGYLRNPVQRWGEKVPTRS